MIKKISRSIAVVFENAICVGNMVRLFGSSRAYMGAQKCGFNHCNIGSHEYRQISQARNDYRSAEIAFLKHNNTHNCKLYHDHCLGWPQQVGRAPMVCNTTTRHWPHVTRPMTTTWHVTNRTLLNWKSAFKPDYNQTKWYTPHSYHSSE